MTFKSEEILDCLTSRTGRVIGVPGRSSFLPMESRSNILSFRSPGRLVLWLSAAFILFGRAENAMAVRTNYLNRPIMAFGAEHALVPKSNGRIWAVGNVSETHEFGRVVYAHPRA